MRIKDRSEAGRELAERLKSLKIKKAHVIALPRGGIPVALEIAKALNAPLNVVISRKVGAPQNPEFGVGACTEEDYYWLDPDALSQLGYSEQDLIPFVRREFREVARRVKLYRKGRNLPDLNGKSILLVDDGIATGVTAKVAAHYLKSKGAKEVILAVPVAPLDSLQELSENVDEIVCLNTPQPFYSVGTWYDDFSQLTDEDVLSLLYEEPQETMNHSGIRA